jgi:hypothetical protein
VSTNYFGGWPISNDLSVTIPTLPVTPTTGAPSLGIKGSFFFARRIAFMVSCFTLVDSHNAFHLLSDQSAEQPGYIERTSACGGLGRRQTQSRQ